MTVPRPQLKYQNVEEKMRKLVASLPEGSRLPSERELAAEFGINFLTARRGVMRLVEDGIVWRKVGSGTFVSAKNSGQTSTAAKSTATVRLGMLIPKNSDAYAHRLMQAVVGAASQQNIEISSCWINDYGPSALRQAEFIKKQGCIATMLPWFEPSRSYEVLELAKSASLPVSHPQILYGFDDNNSSIRRSRIVLQSACAYLRYDNTDTLAFLGPDEPENTFLQQRLGAFSLHCASNNIPHIVGLVKEGSVTMNRLAEQWVAHRGNLSILAYDDDYALRFMTAMHRQGLVAPDDFRIIGFNNTESSRLSDPLLTTIAQNFDHIAHQLVDNALNLARGKPVRFGEMEDMPLIIRESCRGRALLAANPDIKFPGLVCCTEDGIPTGNAGALVS
ncbi:GntR family transcriptional regulator [Rariglobus hedericola]|uniref:GntR family transcriptional regulator n=1 Tax=Rariglobus hedericola TaxID=2597822 RepID=A0A556QSG5_9BACT|nr:substrate-binding domain-containing protein [Rariglobus hedericola]TSJ79584.1 GntR family transcriptional regulator [Rariglobus hedericola]